MSEPSSFFGELKRRNVVRVGVVYLIVAWILAQVADLMLENFEAPGWVIKVILLVLIIGFPISLVFAWAFELTPEGIKKEKDVDRTQSITRQTGRKLDYTIIAVLLVAVAFLLFDRFVPGEGATGEQSGASQAAGEEAQPAAPYAKSIAVLPFVNMSSDPEQEYFSDGISEEILNSLAKVKDLKVAGRTSSFAFKGENKDLRQVGETLGVENILEGSVRKSGTKVRITAQLIQVDDGFHLWSDSYDRELTDVFEIQDEIATAILQQLKAHLLEGEQVAVASTRADSEAYDLYLLAKQRIYERSRPTLEAAAELLDRAIAIDADYAPAYAQRGITAILLSDEDYGTIPADQAEAQAKLYIDQALRLDPNEAEGWAGLGLYYINQNGEADKAIEALEKALAINPNLVDAGNWLNAAYGQAGNPEKALQILEQTVERDPLYRPGIANLTFFYVNTGQTDKAVALIERIRPSMPNDPFLFRMEAQVLFANGSWAQGLQMAEKALALRPDHYPNQGQVGQGLLATGQFERLAVEGHPWQRVVALRALGRLEEATLLAQEEATSGTDVSTLISLLANTGQQAAAVAFFEERWPDFDAFEQDYPLLGDVGIEVMLDLAYAYSGTGNEERSRDALERYRNAMDAATDMGFSSSFMPVMEAVYYALTGDSDSAIAQLDKSVNDGFIMGGKFADGWSAFQMLEGDPAFEKVQARMIEHLNAERSALGLEPIST